jgi:hypothetical protein
MTTNYTDDQIHRIFLEWYFFFTKKELCEKWGITQYRLAKWRQQRPWKTFWTIEDCLIAAIYKGGWHAPADLIGWLDYRNHNLYSEDEVREMFETLEKRGEVRRKGDRWTYVQLEPPFVFGPRVA